MIPQPSNYPNEFDTDENLFLVHDSLRVRLIEDYNPGDSSILIEGDEDVISKFPDTGIITLTEQCSDIDKRAISFYYGSRTSNSFDQLEKLPEFLDVIKPKKITNVTMNVLDKHHNHLKDAVIAIQNFLGVKNEIGLNPLEDTLTKRINFLNKIALRPKAWFTVSTRLGLAPLEVTLKQESVNYNSNSVLTWKYKNSEHTSWTTLPSDPEITFTIENTGFYDIYMEINNSGIKDEMLLERVITVKSQAPEEAKISILYKNGLQIFKEGNVYVLTDNVALCSTDENYVCYNGKENRYKDFPKIRSSTNNFIDLKVSTDKLDSAEEFDSAGSRYEEGAVIDPIVEYTWKLDDDLLHDNSNEARVLYSVGGYYDITLRVDTKFGAYRITNYKDSIDIVENKNLWLFTESNNQLSSYEFGLVSEVFKLYSNQKLPILRDNSFLDYLYNNDNFDSNTSTIAKKEFNNSFNFLQDFDLSSGDQGTCKLFWANGGSEGDSKEISVTDYNGFSDTYSSRNPILEKAWNFIFLASPNYAYFIGGSDFIGGPDPVYPSSNLMDNENLVYNFKNGTSNKEILSFSDSVSQEFLENPSNIVDGRPTNGYFSVFRSTWKDSSGYMLRNSSIGSFFRIGNFYKTNGDFTNEFKSISKLPDMLGSIKTEGQLVTLNSGVFFFNNSGEISAWNDTSLTWEVGRSNVATGTFRSLQDTNQQNFADISNTLLAASDNDSLAYLSFNYSLNSFIKFNLIDQTFSLLSSRPENQIKMGVY